MAPPRPPPNTALTRWCSHHLPRRKLPRSVAASVPIVLAFTTSFVILVYNTSFFFRNRSSVINTPGVVPSFVPPLLLLKHEVDFPNSARNEVGDNEFELGSSDFELLPDNEEVDHNHAHNLSMGGGTNYTDHQHVFVMSNNVSNSPSPTSSDGDLSSGTTSQIEEVFHDKEIFLQNYKEMNTSFKIYIYPHNKKDPFAHSLLPPVDDQNPGGNYASETYFKNVLFKSHFITHDPSEADLFFLPFSIARLRHDRRVGVAGLSDFIKAYMANISTAYPYWNRTGGADHFYVACHSIGRLAMEKVEYVKANAIQVVCSSSYFLPNYYSHKDVGLPQIWPRHEELPNLASSKRKKLAFFAGSMNSPARKAVLQSWHNDTTIFAHSGRLKTPYSEQLLRSKYCLHVKGFEVNTARIGDALYYGCVPVILADYYDLPFMDILNWRSFSVVVATSDIPNLKRILNRISPEEYSVLHGNVLKVRKHFQWNRSPLDFDVFYMVMYELWLRRSSIRVLF